MRFRGIIRNIIRIGLVIVFCFSVVNFIVNLYLLDEIDKQNFKNYATSKSEITYRLVSGKEIKIKFGNESVQIVNSYCLNRIERIETLCFVSYCLDEKEILYTRTIQNLEGELIAHNFLYKLNYQPTHTQSADLEYIEDYRWYGRTITTVMQILGV